ncbi:MAG: response regulator transcription factor [Pseudomonadales bacterium]
MTEDIPTVFVIDDDEPVRDAIGLLLDTVDITHESFGSAQDFLAGYDSHRTGCLVLDIRMPGMSGLELQDHLKEKQDPIPIIFITGHGDIPMAVEAMKKGAIDFIRKPFRDQELLDRIHDAMSQDAENRDHYADLEAVRSHAGELTPREKEVFARVAEGQANKVVAIDLEISERTVEIHRSQVMQKMRARNLADLVKMKILLDQNRS